MKEDYLWDKTGTDPEIESLENVLQAFRYKETAPPALAAKVLPLRKKSSPKIWRFAFAAAACLVFVAISLGALFQISSNKIEVGKGLAEKITPQADIELPKELNDLIGTKVEAPKQSARQKIVKVRKIVSVISHQNKTTANNLKPTKQIVRLTKEEKYAYDQLMLALSITSSKLKAVKDKVRGMEE